MLKTLENKGITLPWVLANHCKQQIILLVCANVLLLTVMMYVSWQDNTSANPAFLKVSNLGEITSLESFYTRPVKFFYFWGVDPVSQMSMRHFQVKCKIKLGLLPSVNLSA